MWRCCRVCFETAVRKDNQNYLLKPPPKSLDYGDLILIPELVDLNLPDACRTLAAFSAQTIVNSVDWLTKLAPAQWILAGGGWENPVILSEFKTRLQNKMSSVLKIMKAEDMGWGNQALEAQIFAYFAVRRLHDLPLSFPQTTGVRMPITGGEIHTP